VDTGWVNALRVAAAGRRNASLNEFSTGTTNGLTHFSRWSNEVILLRQPSAGDQQLINNSVAPVDPADITP
jgi:hypothetical protein